MTGPTSPSTRPPDDTSARSRRRSRRGEGEQLAGEIVDAAASLLVELGGHDAVSMRRIADAVGVTPPAIYNHFDDKNELFYTVCEGHFGELGSAIAAALDGVDGAVERLTAMGRAYVAWAGSNPVVYEMLFGPTAVELVAGRDMTGSSGRLALDLLVHEVAAGIASGALATDLDPLEVALWLWGGLHGMVMIRATKEAIPTAVPLPSRAQHLDAVLDLHLRAITAAPRDG